MIKILDEEIVFQDLQGPKPTCTGVQPQAADCPNCDSLNPKPRCTWSCRIIPGGTFHPNYVGGNCEAACPTSNTLCKITDTNSDGVLDTVVPGKNYDRCKGNCVVPVCGGVGTISNNCEGIVSL